MGWPAEHAHMISNFVDPLPDDLEPVSRADLGIQEEATVLIALGGSSSASASTSSSRRFRVFPKPSTHGLSATVN